jgi:hypothetical protein
VAGIGSVSRSIGTADTYTTVEFRDGNSRSAAYFFALLRAAQYFFIRALTALRCAADILERVRVGSTVSASPRADLATVRLAVREMEARSGNALSSVAASACSSVQRASAPRRAHARMSVECLAIPRDIT